ncbi:MAG: hypothetical protein A3F74_09330 [Betaproteobacteria bacterium RIFCSPLOWO2_12_FULL_62_58]|nr:MAG: hypothetical protein A3F74_09330 [Betaproteobacteria bacterium RIFCSPLOWO2_12_FULL_62_58]
MQTLAVMNPQTVDNVTPVRIADLLADLRGASIGFVDNSKVNADLFLGRLKPLLRDLFGATPGVTVRKLAPKDEISVADLEQLARHDAVIQCFGDCGTSTSMSVADGVRLERRGIPTVTVCSSAFYKAARFQAAGRGMADLPIIEIPHPMHTAPEPVVFQRAEAIVDSVAEVLTRRATRAEAPPLALVRRGGGCRSHRCRRPSVAHQHRGGGRSGHPLAVCADLVQLQPGYPSATLQVLRFK